VNDDEENLAATAAFLGSLSVPPPVDILPYHRLGVDKYRRTGREYRLPQTQPPRGEIIRNAVRLLKKAGLSVTVRGESYGDD
jgi:pyruvate formate lyase activating enzyme